MYAIATATLVALAAMVGSCGRSGSPETGTMAPTAARAEKDIVDTAVDAGQFHTLLAAAQAADLAATLRSEGPFTVFAPTDAAFAKLPAGTVEALLNDKPKLQQLLLYHVVPGRVPASEVVTLERATTAQGGLLPIRVRDGRVHVGEATVIQADVAASNGIIHVIDTVLIPPGW